MTETARTISRNTNDMLMKMLGDGREAGGIAWQLQTKLRRLNQGGSLWTSMNTPGGGGIAVTEEMRAEITELEHMVEESYLMAQRDYTFWKSILQNQRNQMDGAFQLVSVGGDVMRQNEDQRSGENVQFAGERRTHEERKAKRRRKKRDEVQGETRRRGEGVNDAVET